MSDPNNSVCSSSDATGTTTAAAWQILWDAATTLPATTIGCGVKLVGLGLLAGWLIHTLVSVWSVVHYNLQLLYEYVFIAIPDLQIELPPNLYATDVPTPTPSAPSPPVLLDDPAHPGMIQCYDPATLQHLGQVPVCSTADIRQMCAAAAVAQQNWKQTTFCQRRTVLRTLQQYICRHVESIGAATARDSGKAVVDAALGEVLTTTEKIRTICAHGEQWLQPSDNSRPTGPLLLHKTARVEYVPLGVIATIAPWNYPYVKKCGIWSVAIFVGSNYLLGLEQWDALCFVVLVSIIGDQTRALPRKTD